MIERIRTKNILILVIIILLTWPACSLLPQSSSLPPESGKSLIIGNCAFHWRRGGGERKDKLEVTLEEVISGAVYQTHTDSEGFYAIPNVPPGIYTLKFIRFGYQDVTVDHEPLIKLFIIRPGKVFYLGRFVAELDTADLRRGKEYPCYEKYVPGDLTEDELRKILASHKDGESWTDYEIILENELEKF